MVPKILTNPSDLTEAENVPFQDLISREQMEDSSSEEEEGVVRSIDPYDEDDVYSPNLDTIHPFASPSSRISQMHERDRESLWFVVTHLFHLLTRAEAAGFDARITLRDVLDSMMTIAETPASTPISDFVFGGFGPGSVPNETFTIVMPDLIFDKIRQLSPTISNMISALSSEGAALSSEGGHQLTSFIGISSHSAMEDSHFMG